MSQLLFAWHGPNFRRREYTHERLAAGASVQRLWSTGSLCSYGLNPFNARCSMTERPRELDQRFQIGGQLYIEELLFAPLRHDGIYAYASYGKQTMPVDDFIFVVIEFFSLSPTVETL